MKKGVFLSALCSLAFLTACGSKESNTQAKVVAASVAPKVEQMLEKKAPAHAENYVQMLTESQFEEKVARFRENPRVYVGKKPCIVDFYAVWCGPCKKLSPIIEELSVKYKDQIDFYKVDVDRAPTLSEMYGIQSIPTLFFCANGEIRYAVGLVPQTELEEIISEMLAVPQSK